MKKKTIRKKARKFKRIKKKKNKNCLKWDWMNEKKGHLQLLSIQGPFTSSKIQ